MNGCLDNFFSSQASVDHAASTQDPRMTEARILLFSDFEDGDVAVLRLAGFDLVQVRQELIDHRRVTSCYAVFCEVEVWRKSATGTPCNNYQSDAIKTRAYNSPVNFERGANAPTSHR